MKIHVFVLLAFSALAKSSLLEMSQMLWARFLTGGLTKGGLLDPLRVPVIKVDQSEGNTSYRIVLRNVEIRGLNISVLESVHIARGRLKSNLSELEAGYVSYSDLRDLDSVRYRFHTLVKEPKPRNEPDNSAYFATLSNLSKVQPIDGDKFDDRSSSPRSDNLRFQARDRGVDVVYAQNYKQFEKQSPDGQRKQDFGAIREEPRENVGEIKCFGSCINRSRNPSAISSGNANQKYTEFSDEEDHRSEQDDAHVAASESFELKRTFERVNQPGKKIVSSPESRSHRRYYDPRPREAAIKSERGSSLNSHRSTEGAIRNDSRINNYYSPPGYVDIVYADSDDQKIKHFAGFRRTENQTMRVYGLDEIKKDLESRNRYVIHNFTETEALQKRNDMTRAAAESKRIKDLIRYAENFQEKQGYFEQGMQLIYHFGGMGDKGHDETVQTPESNEAKRRKREHNENDAEDDIMHVIIRLRVPMLRVKADYLLTGKVGREILRGNGLLTGNFTDLVGDFTLELKRVNENTMVVRAARARLVADQRKVNLQGMYEKGPVESVLIHGLMAAEAVAAMIADDLATKALNENPPTDAMIYKMYSNNPPALS